MMAAYRGATVAAQLIELVDLNAKDIGVSQHVTNMDLDDLPKLVQRRAVGVENRLGRARERVPSTFD